MIRGRVGGPPAQSVGGRPGGHIRRGPGRPMVGSGGATREGGGGGSGPAVGAKGLQGGRGGGGGNSLAGRTRGALEATQVRIGGTRMESGFVRVGL